MPNPTEEYLVPAITIGEVKIKKGQAIRLWWNWNPIYDPHANKILEALVYFYNNIDLVEGIYPISEYALKKRLAQTWSTHLITTGINVLVSRGYLTCTDGYLRPTPQLIEMLDIAPFISPKMRKILLPLFTSEQGGIQLISEQAFYDALLTLVPKEYVGKLIDHLLQQGYITILTTLASLKPTPSLIHLLRKE